MKFSSMNTTQRKTLKSQQPMYQDTLLANTGIFSSDNKESVKITPLHVKRIKVQPCQAQTNENMQGAAIC